MSVPRIGVLALQGDVREHLAALEACGASGTTVRRPAELDEVDGLIIPGGESTTMSTLLSVFELLTPLRTRLRDGMPAYGSCAGMILLASEVLDTRPDAQHLDGLDITVRRNAFGRQVDSFETDLQFAGIDGDPVRAVFIRAPWVQRVGPGVEVLASVPDGPAAGRVVAVKEGSVMATSFHPEVTGDNRVHKRFVDPVRSTYQLRCPRRTAARPRVNYEHSTSVRKGRYRMSGHSKWATTKHKKAVVDARRGKSFAKLVKNIEVAARTGGGDPVGNPTLYDAIQKAKKTSVPNDNIERARKRGAGEEAGGADWQTIMYEGYGPNGVAVLIECLTDNRNRAAGEVRVAMTRNGGNMADPGSVSYLFSRKGLVTLEKNGQSEDDVLMAVLDAGAEEITDNGDTFEIVSEPTDLVAVRSALQEAGIDYDSAEASFQASVSVPVDADGARKVFKLIDALEESDDVQNVYSNVELSDEVLAELDEE